MNTTVALRSETEAVLSGLKVDLVEIMEAVLDEKLHEMDIEWSENAAMCVVMASGGYPVSFEKGYEIKGLENAEQGIVFHAGTKYIDGKIVTDGGRVLIFSALGKTLDEARAIVYADMEKVNFKDCHYRRDVGLIR